MTSGVPDITSQTMRSFSAHSPTLTSQSPFLLITQAQLCTEHLPLWRKFKSEGKFLAATLTPIQGGMTPRKGVRHYILHVELPGMAEHEEFDSHPLFTKFLAKAQAMQAEDPLVWFGETLFQV